MKWQGRERSSNIEDRRSQGGGGLGGNMGGMGGGRIPIPMGRAGGGGLGIVGIIVVLGVLWFMGVNPLDVLLGNGGGTTT